MPNNSVGIDSFTLNLCLSTSFIMFSIGIIGFILRKNLLIILMCIELMLNSINILFVAFSNFYANGDGQIFVLFSMTIAAAEAAIGLSILVLVYRKTKSVFVTDHTVLKG